MSIFVILTTVAKEYQTLRWFKSCMALELPVVGRTAFQAVSLAESQARLSMNSNSGAFDTSRPQDFLMVSIFNYLSISSLAFFD